MFNYPEGKVFASKTISREKALHMAHFPEVYQKSNEEGEFTLPRGKSGQGWLNFLKNPEKYKKNLIAYGLGCGLQRKGDWLSAYGRGFNVPIDVLASSSVKPTGVRVKYVDVKAASAAREAAERAELEWRASIGSGRMQWISDLHGVYERTKAAASNFDRDNAAFKFINFDDYLKNHEKYHSPLEVDEKYFKEAVKFHNSHIYGVPIRETLELAGVNLAGKISVKDLRQSAIILGGKEVATPLEGSSFLFKSVNSKLTEPTVILGENKLPYIAYGIKTEKTESIARFLIQDVRDGTVYDYAIQELKTFKKNDEESCLFKDFLDNMPKPSEVKEPAPAEANIGNDRTHSFRRS